MKALLLAALVAHAAGLPRVQAARVAPSVRAASATLPPGGGPPQLPPPQAPQPKQAMLPFVVSVALHAVVIGALSFDGAKPKPETRQPIIVELTPGRKPMGDLEKRVVRTTKGRQETPKDQAFLGERDNTVDRQTVGKDSSGRSGKAGPAGTGGQGAKELSLKDLGFRYDFSKAGQGGGPSEHVKGLKEGEQTALNTREFVYFSFYERIRERLDRAWNGELRATLERYARQGRQLRSDSEYTTKVLVVMDHAGVIQKVQILEDSGATDLDKAAVEGFNKAGPFPNPPKGLREPDGTVKVRWDFVLKT